jgi:hypothetical protein
MEWMTEYQRAARMPALQRFHSLETSCWDYFSRMKLETWDLPNTLKINYFEYQAFVERLKEYQQARRMAALQHFILPLKEKIKLALIWWQMQKSLLYALEWEMFVHNDKIFHQMM